MAQTSVRILLINLENLFSPGNSFYGSEYTQDEYDEKIAWIGATIARSQVHAAGLVELGADAEVCITDVMAAANNADTTGWGPFAHEFRAPPGHGGAPIRTALISRFPLTETGSLTTFPEGFCVDLYSPGSNGNAGWRPVPIDSFSRPIARAKLNPENDAAPFNLFVVHLKSKRPSTARHDGYDEAVGIARSAIRRNMEAAALRRYLDEFLPAQYAADERVPTILLGDFNDTPASVPLENIRGPFDRVPGPSRPWSGPDQRRMLNCARLHLKLVAHEDRLYSYVHNESFTLLDQAFVTEHLATRFSRLEMINDHVLRHRELRVDTSQEQQWKSKVSDHGGVIVECTRMLRP